MVSTRRISVYAAIAFFSVGAMFFFKARGQAKEPVPTSEVGLAIPDPVYEAVGDAKGLVPPDVWRPRTEIRTHEDARLKLQALHKWLVANFPNSVQPERQVAYAASRLTLAMQIGDVCFFMSPHNWTEDHMQMAVFAGQLTDWSNPARASNISPVNVPKSDYIWEFGNWARVGSPELEADIVEMEMLANIEKAVKMLREGGARSQNLYRVGNVDVFSAIRGDIVIVASGTTPERFDEIRVNLGVKGVSYLSVARAYYLANQLLAGGGRANPPLIRGIYDPVRQTVEPTTQPLWTTTAPVPDWGFKCDPPAPVQRQGHNQR